MKKLLFINILLTLIFLCLLFLIFFLLNYYIGGPPRYYELLFTNKNISITKHKEKLIYYKKIKKKKEQNYIHVLSEEYNKFLYSGKIKFIECGKIESGFYNLVFKTDKNGFRENHDDLYKNTDFVILGDSFGFSDCENKPNDLISNLNLLNNNYKFLNLSVRGTDYPRQIYNLINFTNKTNYNNLIWFFYEGNDYESKFAKDKHFNILYNQNIILDQNNAKFKYEVDNTFNLTAIYKLRVFLSEFVSGFSTLIKFFKSYDDLLDKENYDLALKEVDFFLDEKKINKRYIYYIPSWQRLSNHKQLKLNLYSLNPQIKQLDRLKKNVKEIAEKYDFVFIDGEKSFINRDKPLDVFHYNLNTHFNKLGYSILAKDLFKNIKELTFNN